MGKSAILDGTLRKVVTQATRNKKSPPLTPRILRLLREAALYVLGAVAIYLLISLWTYSTSDPSWSHRGSSNIVFNNGGRAGAWLSDVLFNLFGYVAYLLPVMIGFSGWHIYQHRKDPEPAGMKHRLLMTGSAFAAVTGATLFLLALFLSGVTIYTGLSWFKLMDSVGRWSFMLADRLHGFISTQIDRFIGMRARRARREVVEE